MTSKKSSRKNEAASAPDEQTFRLMFEGHSAVMLLIEPQTGNILDANQAAADFYGYPKSKLCGMSIHDINTLPPEQVAVQRQKVLNNERNYSTFPHRLANGEVRTVEVHSSPIALQDKRVLFSVIHDITERRQAEKELKKSQARYQAVTQSANEGIVTIDSAGMMVGWNRGAQEIFGYSEAEVSGQPLDMLMPTRFHNEHHAGMVRMQSGGEKHIIDKTVEVEGQHKDGSEFPLEISLSEWQDEGRFYTAIIRDITKRKHMEKALLESEARYRRLADHAPDIIFRYDIHPTMELSYINPAVQSITGYTPEDCYADPFLMMNMIHPDDMNLMAGYMQSLTPPDEPLIARWISKDGSIRWMESRIVPIRDADGQLVAVEGITRDITERKRLAVCRRGNW